VTEQKQTKKVLAVASGGGHWVQLLRLTPAFEDSEAVFVSVIDSYRDQVKPNRFYCIKDATRWDKIALVHMALQLVYIVWKEKPDVVVSTGAAPGYFALRIGKFFGARTIWLDSMANVEHMSMSGNLVQRYADLWLTQWAHLDKPDGPSFRGAVL
jgi:UDP-N-acetylglucosamine:LPS N-acetylglucosamine transferase